MTKHRRRPVRVLGMALGEMSSLSFIKVLMLTAFLDRGEIIYQEHKETTFTKCELAEEEAIRFNNRFLWPWENEIRISRRVVVACFWHPETKEM